MNMHNWLFFFQSVKPPFWLFRFISMHVARHEMVSASQHVQVVWGSLTETPQRIYTVLWLLHPQTFLHSIAARPPSSFFSFSQTTHSWSGKEGNNTGTKTRLPLERREQHFHSEYDNRLLNYIKPQCSPHSAGMSPLTQRNFIALPSHCPGDTRGTKASGDPMGHLPDSPLRCTLWAWHNFPVRRHKSLCHPVFVSHNKAWKRKEKNNPNSCSETLSLHPFILQTGVCIVGWRR